MPLTNAMKAKLLDHLYGGASLSQPTKLYLGLSTTTPNADGGNVTEPSGNGYQRIEISNDSTFWEAATVANPAIKQNKITVEFPRAIGPWGEITHWVLFDGNTVVDFAALEIPKIITKGDIARFEPGGIQTILRNAE